MNYINYQFLPNGQIVARNGELDFHSIYHNNSNLFDNSNLFQHVAYRYGVINTYNSQLISNSAILIGIVIFGIILNKLK
jgi:hypothetical protein